MSVVPDIGEIVEALIAWSKKDKGNNFAIVVSEKGRHFAVIPGDESANLFDRGSEMVESSKTFQKNTERNGQ